MKKPLKCCFGADAKFVLGDPIEIDRPEGNHTDYTGRIGEEKKRGFWLLTLGTSLRGCALPCNFITYSSSAIGSEKTSPNLEHRRVMDEIAATIDDPPLVLDREFSY